MRSQVGLPDSTSSPFTDSRMSTIVPRGTRPTIGALTLGADRTRTGRVSAPGNTRARLAIAVGERVATVAGRAVAVAGGRGVAVADAAAGRGVDDAGAAGTGVTVGAAASGGSGTSADGRGSAGVGANRPGGWYSTASGSCVGVARSFSLSIALRRVASAITVGTTATSGRLGGASEADGAR